MLTSTESGSQHRFHCTDKPIDDVFFTLPSRLLAPSSLLPLRLVVVDLYLGINETHSAMAVAATAAVAAAEAAAALLHLE